MAIHHLFEPAIHGPRLPCPVAEGTMNSNSVLRNLKICPSFAEGKKKSQVEEYLEFYNGEGVLKYGLLQAR